MQSAEVYGVGILSIWEVETLVKGIILLPGIVREDEDTKNQIQANWVVVRRLGQRLDQNRKS